MQINIHTHTSLKRIKKYGGKSSCQTFEIICHIAPVFKKKPAMKVWPLAFSILMQSRPQKRANKQRTKILSSLSLYGLSAKSLAQISGGSSHL